MKKGQMQGQIFIYILAIVVVGGILLYGYSAIKDFSARGEQVAFLSFKQSFENNVKTMVSDYGTIKRPDFDVPSKYRHVCVIDYSRGSDALITGPGQSVSCDKEPIVCNAWKFAYSQYNDLPDDKKSTMTSDNVFLTPDGSESFHVAKLKIDNGGICAPVKNGKVNIQFKSVGNAVEVSIYE